MEPLVSVLEPNGRVGKTFGESYRSPSALVRREMSEGVIGCDASGRALIGLVKMPLVTAYSEDGRVQRRLRFREFETSTSGDIFAMQVSRFELSRGRRSFPEVGVQTYLPNVVTFEAVDTLQNRARSLDASVVTVGVAREADVVTGIT